MPLKNFCSRCGRHFEVGPDEVGLTEPWEAGTATCLACHRRVCRDPGCSITLQSESDFLWQACRQCADRLGLWSRSSTGWPAATAAFLRDAPDPDRCLDAAMRGLQKLLALGSPTITCPACQRTRIGLERVFFGFALCERCHRFVCPGCVVRRSGCPLPQHYRLECTVCNERAGGVRPTARRELTCSFCSKVYNWRHDYEDGLGLCDYCGAAACASCMRGVRFDGVPARGCPKCLDPARPTLRSPLNPCGQP